MDKGEFFELRAEIKTGEIKAVAIDEDEYQKNIERLRYSAKAWAEYYRRYKPDVKFFYQP